MALLGIRGTGTIIEETRDIYFYTNKQIDAFLADKEDRIAYGTTSQYWRGDKTWQVITGGGGGGPVDWTDIVNKPSTFPPTLPIEESDVTNLVVDLAAKEPIITAGTTSQYWRGDKTWQTLPTGGGGGIPEAPTDGQQYGRQSSGWTVITGGGGGSGANISIGDAPPIAPNIKDLWWKSDLGNMFIYYNDGTSSQWVPSTVSERGAQGPQGIQGTQGTQGVQGPPGADSAISPGAISAFARSTPPTGWLKANGALLSRTTYAALFSAIGTTFGVGDGSTTFALPDLRGEFPRFWDDSRGIDSGRSFGTAQTGDTASHTHPISFTSGAQSADHTHTASGTTSGVSANHTHTFSDSSSATGTESVYHTHSYTRPILASDTDRGGSSSAWSIDSSQSAATIQQNVLHTHTVAVSGTTGSNSVGHTHTFSDVTTGISVGHTHLVSGTSGATGGTETRPRNIALLACIKY